MESSVAERTIHLNRTLALDEYFARLHDRQITLPQEARRLGGHVAEGHGDYYRQVMAPVQTLEQDAHGDWIAKWIEHGRADHYAHAEVYCYAAEVLTPRPPNIRFIRY